MNFLNPYQYHCDSPYAYPEYLMDNHRPSTSGVKYQHQEKSLPILQPLHKPPEKKPVEFQSLFSVSLIPSLEEEKKK